MELVIIGLTSVILIGAGALIALFSWRSINTDNLSTRLNEYVTEETGNISPTRNFVSSSSREMAGSLPRRVLLPLVKNIGQFFGRLTPTSQIENLRHQLTIAGNPMGLGAREFYGLRIVSILTGILVALLLLRMGRGPTGSIDIKFWAAAGFALLVFFLLPTSWLQSKVRRRQDSIRKGLPDALDMLSVCATAGLGFDQALQRVSEHWNTPVGAEFGRVIHEMEMGLSRREALRNMADRLDVSELSSFVAFVLQSEQLGMAISDVLHTQAAQMRAERRFRAQEQAQKIPTKMLIPMAFLIFPAILAVVLGPALPKLFTVFSTF
jgi:tight adherence protein C